MLAEEGKKKLKCWKEQQGSTGNRGNGRVPLYLTHGKRLIIGNGWHTRRRKKGTQQLKGEAKRNRGRREGSYNGKRGATLLRGRI